MNEIPLLLKPDEAARLLGVSRTKVYTLIGRRDIPSIRMGGSIRVPREALEAWVRANTEAAPA